MNLSYMMTCLKHIAELIWMARSIWFTAIDFDHWYVSWLNVSLTLKNRLTSNEINELKRLQNDSTFARPFLFFLFCCRSLNSIIVILFSHLRHRILDWITLLPIPNCGCYFDTNIIAIYISFDFNWLRRLIHNLIGVKFGT